MSDQKCPVCGMTRNEWKHNNGSGYEEKYCCPGCGNGTGCECNVASVTDDNDDQPENRDE